MRTYREDFFVPADHLVKRDRYLDLARERRKLWIMRVTVIPNVISVLGTITKDLERGWEELELEDESKQSRL